MLFLSFWSLASASVNGREALITASWDPPFLHRALVLRSCTWRKPAWEAPLRLFFKLSGGFWGRFSGLQVALQITQVTLLAFQFAYWCPQAHHERDLFQRYAAFPASHMMAAKKGRHFSRETDRVAAVYPWSTFRPPFGGENLPKRRKGAFQDAQG